MNYVSGLTTERYGGIVVLSYRLKSEKIKNAYFLTKLGAWEFILDIDIENLF